MDARGGAAGRNTLQEVAGDETETGVKRDHRWTWWGGERKEKRGAVGLHTECSEFLPNSLAVATRVSRDG